jgi:hypothetical protein
MVRASGPMSKKSSSQRFVPATSSSWTISAVKTQSRTPVHSHRWRQALLPAQMLAGAEPDRADLRQAHALVARGRRTLCRKLSAQQLPEYSPHLPTTDAQIIYKVFRPCVGLIAVMHGDARDQFCVDACQQHAPGKAMRLSVASYLSIAL